MPSEQRDAKFIHEIVHYEYFYTLSFGLDGAKYNDKKILDIGCGPIGVSGGQGVLSWGLSDRFTGHNRWPREYGWALRALPYDYYMQPKLARREIAEAFLSHDADR